MMELIIYLLIGAIAGFAAGLFGVGGGLIIVPILYIVFTQLNYDPNVLMHMAVGTSLATIIVTSISSVMAHHKRGAVLWAVFKNLAPGLVLGSFWERVWQICCLDSICSWLLGCLPYGLHTRCSGAHMFR